MNVSGWRIAAASVAGTSHERSGTPCQDAHAFDILDLDEGSAAVFVASDGAGSASFSEIGASIACRRSIEEISGSLKQGIPVPGRLADTVASWVDGVRDSISAKAIELDVRPGELACTLLIAILLDERTIAAQIGDGSIVARTGGEWHCLHWPQHGEFANTTNFVTSRNACDCLDISDRPERTDEVALFTDGIERLVLHYQSRSVHGPFFDRIFEPLRRAVTPEAAGRLSEQLGQYLRSPTITSRTDDDATLVLASREFAGADG
ncbi:MAG: PP2C family serine/threonine-protein phosphatase [Minwuia sp.]|uniref:PP2C family serine/threonine-protein phosphatase n=1 Tax=Minwuia sp. TaxID=2493630 RepID=UPI003A87D7F3